MASYDFVIKTDNTKQVLSDEAEAVNTVLELIGQFVEDEAKLNITKQGLVDTGNMRNSMTHEVRKDEKAVYIGTPVEYAIYNELGHRQEVGRYVPAINARLKNPYVPPRPFLKPAVENNKDKINGFIKKHLGGT